MIKQYLPKISALRPWFKFPARNATKFGYNLLKFLFANLPADVNDVNSGHDG